MSSGRGIPASSVAPHANIRECRPRHDIQPTSVNQPSARSVEGGGDHGPLAHRTVMVATSDQKARRGIHPRNGCARRTRVIPAIHMAPSIASVPGIEFHSPRPTRGEPVPGHSGMSTACVTPATSQPRFARGAARLAASATARCPGDLDLRIDDSRRERTLGRPPTLFVPEGQLALDSSAHSCPHPLREHFQGAFL